MKKHIILSLFRSGSNYLANLLNSHPQVTNYGEVLGDWTIPYNLYSKTKLGGKSTEDYLDFIYNSKLFFAAGQAYSAMVHIRKGKKINFKYWSDIETIGVKDFSINFRDRKIASYLTKRSDIRVVNLYRENILKRLISLERQHASGITKVAKNERHKDSKTDRKIQLDVPYVLEQLEIFDRELRDHKNMVKELPQSRVLNICYEDLFASQDSRDLYTRELLDFLEVESTTIKSDHRKILSDKLSDIVANYDELENGIRGRRFSRYLD